MKPGLRLVLLSPRLVPRGSDATSCINDGEALNDIAKNPRKAKKIAPFGTISF